MSFPPGTEMFQFPGFASAAYGFSGGYPPEGGVAPFGDPRIKACSRLPTAFRSVPRPSSPLGAKASTRCPCFPRPPPATTTPCAPPPATRAGTPPVSTAQTEKRMRQPPPGTIPATTTNYKPCRPPPREREKRQAYPCQHTALPQTEEEGNGHALPAPAAPRRMHGGSSSHARATGTSSPPHDVQRTCPRTGPRRRTGRRARGPSFGRPGQARATTAAPPPDGEASLVGLGRLERPTSRLSGVRSNQLSYRPERHPAGPKQRAAEGRANRPPHPRTSIRRLCEGTCRRRRAITPGGERTSPQLHAAARARDGGSPTKRDQTVADRRRKLGCLRKEVIQPQVPLRLPCYDFTPVADPTVDACPPLRG